MLKNLQHLEEVCDVTLVSEDYVRLVLAVCLTILMWTVLLL